MSHYQLVQKLFPTLMMIVVICVAGFLKNSIKQEKLLKENRRVLEERVAHENALLARERFLRDHNEFLATFLEYEGQCHKIHALLYRNQPKEVTSSRTKCCPFVTHQTTIQPGDRAPLNYAIVYVFICILVFLFVRAVIDVSKEIRSPEQATTKFSLKDYASSSRRCSVRRDSRLSRLFSMDDAAVAAIHNNNKKHESPTRIKRSSISTSSRRVSLAQYLLKDMDEIRQPSFDSVTEEEDSLKKHRKA